MESNRRPLLCVLAVCAAIAVWPARAEWRAEGPSLGTVNDLAYSTTQPGTVYAATAGGGVWRSDDGGASWRLAGDGMTSRHVAWVEIDPNDDQRLWVGLDGSGSASAMWRSVDAGATWEPVSATYDGGMQMRPLGQPIAFLPESTILVPSTNQHYRSDDGGETWKGFRVPNQDAYVFAAHPTDPKTVLAGGRGQSLNVSRSTDGGNTWRQTGIGLDQSVRDLFYDHADPSVVYAVGGTFGKVFKSTDGGDEFTELTLPVGGTTRVFSVVMDPADSKVLWASTERGLLKSADGGVSWSPSGRGFGRYLCKTVAFAPGAPSTMLAGTGGTGVYRSGDGGSSWSPSSDGLAAGWVEGLYGSPRGPVVFAQMSVGLFRLDPERGWEEVTRPIEEDDPVEVDGIAFDRRSAKTVYAFDTSKLWVSENGGQGWVQMEVEGPSMRDMMKGITDSAQFASFVQDPGDPKVLYAGSWSNDSEGGAVYKTENAGKKWKPSGQGLPSGERVEMLRSAASGVVLALVDDHGLFRTADGGGSWSRAGSGLPDAEIAELVVDPGTPSRLFAATEAGLYRSTDGGAGWARVSQGIEGDEVAAVAVDPASGTVFAGTFHGVFASSDGGSAWSAVSARLHHADVRGLAVAGGRLWAGTAGGSVYSRELP